MWSACLLECLAEAAGEPAELTAMDLRPHLRTGFPWHEHELPHGHLADPDAWWASLQVVLRNALIAAGVRAELAQAAAGLVRHRFTDPRKWLVLSDAATCLDTLRRAGWHNVIVSNHVPELERLVGDLGLSDAVDAVFSSALVGWEKPHPQFYLHVLDRLGRPSQVWMVGDNPVADVAGARAVGIPALLVDPSAATGPQLRDAVNTILR
jgi:putative hydrolase of the HAD superfamily